jgi:hypothetical protein
LGFSKPPADEDISPPFKPVKEIVQEEKKYEYHPGRTSLS